MHKNIYLAFLFLLLIIISSFFIYSEYQVNLYIPPSDQVIKSHTNLIIYPSKHIREPKLKDIPEVNSLNVKYSGWIPTWAMDSGLISLKENIEKFESISPVFYHINEEGEIKKNTNFLNELKAATKGKIKLIPTISSFDADGLTKHLNNPSLLNKFLMDEIIQNEFDGIDLNYESIYLKDKEAFFAHVDFLSKELRSRGKQLYVTVYAKWSENINYGFANQTRAVHDYKKISQYAHQIRIMTYDYTSQTSPTPGPIAPIEWIEEVLKYATNRVDPSKLSLGIHLYGYVWNEKAYQKNQKRALGLSYRQISQIKNKNSSQQTIFNTNYKEKIIYYSEHDNEFYFGYYSDPETIKERILMAAKYGLKSVSFWRLGDDPL